MIQETASWPTVEAYLYAFREDSPVGNALALHYPAASGDAPETCAVCYGYARMVELVPEPWPCPTVRALLPRYGSARGRA